MRRLLIGTRHLMPHIETFRRTTLVMGKLLDGEVHRESFDRPIVQGARSLVGREGTLNYSSKIVDLTVHGQCYAGVPTPVLVASERPAIAKVSSASIDQARGRLNSRSSQASTVFDLWSVETGQSRFTAFLHGVVMSASR